MDNNTYAYSLCSMVQSFEKQWNSIIQPPVDSTKTWLQASRNMVVIKVKRFFFFFFFNALLPSLQQPQFNLLSCSKKKMIFKRTKKKNVFRKISLSSCGESFYKYLKYYKEQLPVA
jgi:hypothetical protein